MNITVFYAWQSDRPEKLNHYLIRDAAQEACKRITADSTNDWSVNPDSDTQGTPGMCDIPNTILKKIRKCDIFLADLTLVGKTESEHPKPLPNTNVVFELGYAVRHLEFKALVGVVNEAFGKVEGQIFDIKRRACLRYSAEASNSKPDLKRTVESLSKELEKIIHRTIEAVVIPKRNKAAARAIDLLREQQLAKARAGQQAYVAVLCKSLEKEFAGLVKEYLASNEGASKLEQRAPAYYECSIWPAFPLDKPVMDTLAACRSTLNQCQIGPSTSPFPDINHSRLSTGQDWVGGRMNNYGLECWRLSQQAVFAMILSAREVVRPPRAQPCISLEDMLFRLTQLFRFTAKLAERTTADGNVEVAVRLREIGNRPLLIEGVFETYKDPTSENELSYSCHCSQEGLNDPDLLAVKAAYWFCERLNWQTVTETLLANVQGQFSHQL